MPPTRATAWTCPGCQRRVPARVEECYCGAKRSQAGRAEVGDRGSRGVLWTGAALLAAIGLLAVVSLRRSAPPPVPSSASPPRAPGFPKLASPASPPPIQRQAPLPAPASAPATPLEESPTAAPAVPTPGPQTSPSPEESLDEHRRRAAETFDRALQQLAAKAQHLRKEVQHYRSGCQSGGGPWPPAGCDAARQELRQSLEELQKALEGTDEDARRASVYPGVRAEIRRRHGLDEDAWAALLRNAREAVE